VLAFMECHWGSSEHALAGRREAAELQLYHYNPYHASVKDALEAGDLVALSVLLKVFYLR